MKLKHHLLPCETKELQRDIEALNRSILYLTGNPCVGAPRTDYLRCLKPLAASPWMVDHLEGAGFFVATFAFLFPGLGLRQELENATAAEECGWDWCYEAYGRDNAPIGVQLEEGYECVFPGKTPLQAIVRMLTLFIEHRNEVCQELLDRREEEIKTAMMAEPEALPAPKRGSHADA